MPRNRTKETRYETVLRYKTEDGYTGAIVKLRTVEVEESPPTPPAEKVENKTRKRIR